MSNKHVTEVKCIEGLDTTYIDLPGSLFTDMGWNENTKLMWFINDNGQACIRPPKYDAEVGIPVEFISFLESTDENDSSNKT
jgi:hypothetical protein